MEFLIYDMKNLKAGWEDKSERNKRDCLSIKYLRIVDCFYFCTYRQAQFCSICELWYINPKRS